MSTQEWKDSHREYIRQHAKEYYYKNREKILSTKKTSEQKEKQRATKYKYRQSHKEEIALRDQKPARRLSTARSLANKRGHNWNLTLQEYTEIIKNPCYYCEGFFGKTVKGSGLDRKNNDLGYSIDNVLSCCGFCNRLRSDVLTVEECKTMISLLIIMRLDNSTNIKS